MSNSERPHKRRPKDVIEESQPANVEQAFVKQPGKEMRHIGKGTSMGVNYQCVDNNHQIIHTHLAKISEGDKEVQQIIKDSNVEEQDFIKMHENIAALHSAGDFEGFFLEPRQKFSTVAVRDPKSSELLGYNVIKKTKQTPAFVTDSSFNPKNLWELLKLDLEIGSTYKDIVALYKSRADSTRQNSPSIYKDAYDSFLKKYGLKSRLVPAEGYELNEYKTAFVKKEE